MANRFGAALRDNMKESENRVEKAINGQPEPIVNNEQGGVGQIAQPIPEVNQQRQSLAQPVGAKPKKEKNGIVIDVPMDDYMKLTMMKLQTGRTLKDLALQAIHEFVERNAIHNS